MIILESIKLALNAIWANKARSLLTMLGIIIGISSVVTLMSIGEGVKRDVKKTVEDLGSNFIFVLPGNVNVGSGGGGAGAFGNPANLISGDILKKDDITQIKKIPGVETAAAMTLVSGIIKKNDKTASPTIAGVEPQFKDILSGFKLEKGRFFTEEDNNNKLIILGSDAAKQLFGGDDILGKKVNIINAEKKVNQEFEVIGEFSKPTGGGNLFSSDISSITVIPFSTAKDFNGGQDKIFRIGVKVTDSDQVKNVTEEIKKKMKELHPDNDISVITQEDILGILGDVLNLLTTFVAAIAAISLIVGGVGIMNIMLVSVTERTREIGLRKAVGATNGAILMQFLTEAVILSVAGGLISLGIVEIVVSIIKIKTSLHPIVTPSSVFLAIGVCVVIGLIFGIMPAVRAAKKNPIDALRYE